MLYIRQQFGQNSRTGVVALVDLMRAKRERHW